LNKIYIISAIVLLLLPLACNKEELQNPVPNIPFEVTLNLTLPIYEPLKNEIGAVVYYDAGSRGLAITRISNTEFAVFDRHCPYRVTEGCQVVADTSAFGGLIDKNCCNSTFNMFNGGLPGSGPATFGLRPYNYNYNGTILRIYN
jgi:hypothetical protein